MFKTWKALRIHAYKIHENDKDDEGNKKGITEDNVVHKDEDKNYEAELKPNNHRQRTSHAKNGFKKAPPQR